MQRTITITTNTAADASTAEAVRFQLRRIVTCDAFARSDRLAKFLQFVTEERLAGRSDTLKERVIANELYGRTGSEAGNDPIVRVDARRLRDKLREYYASSPDDTLLITLPKGSYIPSIRANQTQIQTRADLGQGGIGVGTREIVAWSLVAPCVLALAAIILSFPKVPLDSWTPIRILLPSPSGLTLSELRTTGPAVISPDGHQLAFVAAATGEAPQLWLQPLDSMSPRPLAGTTGAMYPFWSPDSLHIAFFAERKLKRIEHKGGGVLTLADAPAGRGGSWSRRGHRLCA